MAKVGNQETLKWEKMSVALCVPSNIDNIFLTFYSNMFDVNVFVYKDKFYHEQLRTNSD